MLEATHEESVAGVDGRAAPVVLNAFYVSHVVSQGLSNTFQFERACSAGGHAQILLVTPAEETL